MFFLPALASCAAAYSVLTMGALNMTKLNVGGQIFEVPRDALEQSAYLRDLGKDASQVDATLIQDDDSISFFIDRDSKIFGDILHYLRTWEIQSTDEHYLRILKSEAIFYGIDGLIRKINQMQPSTSLSDNLQHTYKSKAVDYIPVGFNTAKFDSTSNETVVQAFTYTVGHDRQASKIVVKKS